jgi:hypothetical protein
MCAGSRASAIKCWMEVSNARRLNAIADETAG